MAQAQKHNHQGNLDSTSIYIILEPLPSTTDFSEYIRKRENQKQAPPPPGDPLKRALHTSSQQQDAKSRGAATTALELIFSWSREWQQSAKQMAAARAMASEPEHT
jgi:hypothetical protein